MDCLKEEMSARAAAGAQWTPRNRTWQRPPPLRRPISFLLLGLVALLLTLMRPRGGQAAPNLLPVPLPPLLYGHAVPAIASKAYAIGGAIPQPPSFIPLATDPISSTVYVLDVPAALQGTDSPWTVDASANLTVNSPATLPSGVGSKPPPLLHHCAVPVAHRILVLFGQTVAPDGSRVASNYPPLWFDPAEGTWSPLKQDGADWITPNPRYMHSCAFHGATARVFVFGGIMKGDDGKEVETNELWTLDVNDGWWEQVDLERINGVSLERRRVGSSMHIVNGWVWGRRARDRHIFFLLIPLLQHTF